MRKVALSFVSVMLLAFAGCGCIEKYTDPRFDDRPIFNEKYAFPRDPAEFPDAEQPGWHRCLFGTRWLSLSPGLTGGPDPDQPTWQRRLFGPRYLPRWSGWDNEGPPPTPGQPSGG